MNNTDSSFEAKAILQQLKKSDVEEQARRLATSDTWTVDNMERASTFIKRMNDTKANLPLNQFAVIYAFFFYARRLSMKRS